MSGIGQIFLNNPVQTPTTPSELWLLDLNQVFWLKSRKSANLHNSRISFIQLQNP